MNNVINSVSAYLMEIERACSESRLWVGISDWPILFRGHTNFEWPLLSTIGREWNEFGGGNIRAETILNFEIRQLAEFKKLSYPYFGDYPMPAGGTDWEWIALSRHYGLPSRAMDWTESPLVGLFFAVNNFDDEFENDGAVFILGDKQPLTREEYIPELPRLSDEDVPLSPFEVADTNLTIYSTSMRFPRLDAQSGALVITSSPDEDLVDKEPERIIKLRIPKDAKLGILRDLDAMGINFRRLFPDLGGVSQYLRSRYYRLYKLGLIRVQESPEDRE